jgi:hypothetical protein
MQHENDEKQLKQERKREYKFSILHVLINETFSLLFSFKGNDTGTKSRDLVCFLTQTKLQGCITALMENYKNVITTSLDIDYTKDNFKDLLLTRVNFDPFLFTQVQFFNSKLVISKTNRTKPVVIVLYAVVPEHKLSRNQKSMSFNSFCDNYQTKINGTNFWKNLFFIRGYKNLTVNNNCCHVKFLFFCIYSFCNGF